MAIKVLLVEDSLTARKMLSDIICSDAEMLIVGEATDGQQAIEMVGRLRPDIIIMDANLPGLGGVDATREIMHSFPTPIVIISANIHSPKTNLVFDAINAGALAVIEKPHGPGSENFVTQSKELLTTLRSMATVRVIRHWRAGKLPSAVKNPTSYPINIYAQPEIIVIAASTGGPQTIKEIIKSLPLTFNLPIVIVQHISSDFVFAMANWLNTVSPLPIRIPNSGEKPLPGTIYIAPGNQHLVMTADHRFELNDTPTDLLHRPSCDILLTSIAEHYGKSAVGIVLTGMGNDGARGLRAMYDVGATTIAQSKESCIVFGMPNEAIALGAARLILSPQEISGFFLQFSI